MISPEQREARRRYIGSSDVPAILGMSPWATAADVWLAKTNDLPDKPNASMRMGTLLERPLLDYAAEDLGVPLARDLMLVETGEKPLFAANLDAAVLAPAGDPVELVEAKTSGIIGGNVDEAWGEDGTDEVPDHVLLQVQEQMHVARVEVTHVYALLARVGVRHYIVPRDEAIIDAIRQRGREFWDRYVVTRTPPPDSVPSLDLVRRVRREPNKITAMDLHVVERWLAAKAAAKTADDEREQAEALLHVFMGDAEAGDCALGRVSFKPQTAKRLDLDALRRELPDVAQRFTRESTHSVLRWKPTKTAE
jgi:putative phage-type endonuclease